MAAYWPSKKHMTAESPLSNVPIGICTFVSRSKRRSNVPVVSRCNPESWQQRLMVRDLARCCQPSRRHLPPPAFATQFTLGLVQGPVAPMSLVVICAYTFQPRGLTSIGTTSSLTLSASERFVCSCLRQTTSVALQSRRPTTNAPDGAIRGVINVY